MNTLNTTKVNYVDTWFILGHYDMNHDRVEISSFLKQYPELHDFCVNHEIKHVEIYSKHKFSWRHYILDIKDRFKLHNDRTLSTQLRSFREEIKPKHIDTFVFIIFYQFISMLTFFLQFIEIRHVINKERILNIFSKIKQRRGRM